jgi:hypothetical protein
MKTTETYTSTNSTKILDAKVEIQDYLEKWGFTTEEKVDGEMLNCAIKEILIKYFESSDENLFNFIPNYDIEKDPYYRF